MLNPKWQLSLSQKNTLKYIKIDFKPTMLQYPSKIHHPKNNPLLLIFYEMLVGCYKFNEVKSKKMCCLFWKLWFKY